MDGNPTKNVAHSALANHKRKLLQLDFAFFFPGGEVLNMQCPKKIKGLPLAA